MRTTLRPALAVGLAFLVLVAAACSDEDNGADPSVWLAFASNPAVTAPPADRESVLRVVDLASGDEREFGEPGLYLDVAWSPDGTRLAVVYVADMAAEQPQLRLGIWGLDGFEVVDLVFPEGRGGNDIEWSPDGTRLAVIGHDAIGILDASGEEVAWAVATPGASGSTQMGQHYGASRWSPDSQFVSVIANNLLFVVGRTGEAAEHDLPATTEEAGPRQGRSTMGWSATGQPLVLSLRHDGDTVTVAQYTGTLGDGSIAWSEPAPFDFAALFPDDAERAALDALVADHRVTTTQETADGDAHFHVLAADEKERFGSVPIAVAVEVGERTSVVTLGEVGSSGLGSSLNAVDVVVQPGWEGELPPRREVKLVPAAVPGSPTPSPPRGTPPPEPTYSGEPDPAVTVIPYPDPRGERVSPQVAGVPAFPGAEEIDGFVQPGGVSGLTTQMFATSVSGAEVLSFFERELNGQGYRKTSGSAGVSGGSTEFERGRDRVLVSTEYIYRPEDEPPSGEQPPGFRGKGAPFLPGNDGMTWFFIVTVRAPEPSAR